MLWNICVKLPVIGGVSAPQGPKIKMSEQKIKQFDKKTGSKICKILFLEANVKINVTFPCLFTEDFYFKVEKQTVFAQKRQYIKKRKTETHAMLRCHLIDITPRRVCVKTAIEKSYDCSVSCFSPRLFFHTQEQSVELFSGKYVMRTEN